MNPPPVKEQTPYLIVTAPYEPESPSAYCILFPSNDHYSIGNTDGLRSVVTAPRKPGAVTALA